jgi:glycosyltransferase
VAGLDIEVVATLNDLQLQGVPHIPDNVRVIEWVPLTHLLPTCSAIIHHGGPGTFAAAVAHGVPQLVCDTEESILIRREYDQPTTDTGTYQLGREFGVREETVAPRFVIPAKNIEASLAAAYVCQHGAGMLLNHRTQTVEEIGRNVLNVITNPDYRHGANAIYETWLATPSPATIVHTLETLTAHRRRPPTAVS